MSTEKNLQDYMKRQAKNNGISFFKLESVGRTGFPDVMLAHKGQAVFVELKSPKGTGVLSARQKLIINELRAQGLTCHVIHTKEAADNIITSLTHRKPERSN
jgi:hypothetical protein